MHKYYFYLLLILIVSSCAPSRFVVPLKKDQKAINVSLGGPLFKNFGPPIPIPLTTVAGGYGFRDDITGYAAIHPTALLYGTLMMDAGATKGWLKPDVFVPGLSSSVTANMALGLREGGFRLWPQLDVNAYWLYGKKSNVIYTGLSNWFELSGVKAHDETQERHWLPSILLGNTFAGNKINFTIEYKYILPGVESDKTVVEYVGFNGKGTNGLYFSITKKL